MTADLDSIKTLEDNGIAAVVMHSLFEEQINHEAHELDHFLYKNNETSAEAVDFFQDDLCFDNIEADDYLQEIENTKRSVAVPVIASLNGVSAGGWAKYAKKLQEAGADALELNITYIPTSVHLSGLEVEKMYVDTVQTVKKEISIPLNLKMNAYFSNPANMAKQFVDAGACGLTLFDNPANVDIDLAELAPLHEANTTTSKDLSESLRWCAILYKQLRASLCANTGIHTAPDLLKAIMSGADAAAIASVLLQNGHGQVAAILQQLRQWMEENEYASIEQMKGSISLRHSSNPAAFERNSYMQALNSYRI